MQEVWAKIIALLDRASKQHHIVALRDGMIGSVPIILIGSTFLLLGAQTQMIDEIDKLLPGFAASGLALSYKAHVPLLLMPYRFTMGMLSLYVAFTIASSLAKQYGLPTNPQGLGAMAALLVTGTPVQTELEGAKAWVLAMKPLGAEGLFLAIFLGIFTVELSRLILRPDPSASPDAEKAREGAVPPAVTQAFAAFLPLLLVISIVWYIRHSLGFDINQWIIDQTSWLKQMGDTLGAVLVVNLLLHIFGVAGVHGISVINAAMLPIWQQFVAANAEAQANGLPLEHVTAYPFYQWFIWIGGAGATLAPTILLFLSKNDHMRRIGKISIVPALFNVNEPLLFGLPVVANPILAIPFILAPMVCGVVAFVAVASGVVGKPFIEVPWVMPCFLGAPLSCQDFKAFLLLIVNLCISGAIWFPFLKAYERRLEGAPAQGNDEPNGNDS
ncbi:MAG: PTS sugar transporter subunit IIC [Vulcanimicrobiota bacterium]